MKEYAIGEKFKHNGVWLEVVSENKEDVCEGCFFYNDDKYGITPGGCISGANNDITDLCSRKGIIYKEVKMDKPIFENEKEVDDFVTEITDKTGIDEDMTGLIIENIIDKGYIARSALEEAKKDFLEDIFLHGSSEIIRRYVSLLEEEVERPKE